MANPKDAGTKVRTWAAADLVLVKVKTNPKPQR